MSRDDTQTSQPMPEAHSIDTAALTAWLHANLPGFEGPISLEVFKGGQSNPTYKLTTPHKNYVMRTKPGPVAKLLPSAHAIEREFKVMHGLYGTDVPVPQMHVLCEDESIMGRAFYLMEYVQGRVLWDQTLPGMTNTERAAIYDEMNSVIAALHTVKFAERGLESYGRPGNYFDRQIGRWSKQYVASVTQPIDEMDQLMAWLPANMPASAKDESKVSIVHGDYRLDNLMFHPTQPRVLAVLDWELSTLGDPLGDFSYVAMAWVTDNGGRSGVQDLDRKSLGIPELEEVVERYCERTGRTSVPDMNWYFAYNFFRLAGIMQGIKKRVIDGTASSAHAKAMSDRVQPLVDRAAEFARKSGM